MLDWIIFIACSALIMLCLYNLTILAWAGPPLHRQQDTLAEMHDALGDRERFWAARERHMELVREHDRRMAWMFPPFVFRTGRRKG